MSGAEIHRMLKFGEVIIQNCQIFFDWKSSKIFSLDSFLNLFETNLQAQAWRIVQ